MLDALKGFDVVISLVNVPAGPNNEILASVIANQPKLYIPSQFGCDVEATQADFPGFLSIKSDHSNAARAAGIKTVDIASTFFYDGETFIGIPVPFYPIKDNSIEIIGEENAEVQFSNFKDIGQVVAIASTYPDYSKLPDKLRIYSDSTTVGALIEKYEKKNGVKLSVSHKDFASTFSTLKENHAKNGVDWTQFVTYLNLIQISGDGKGAIFTSENEREFINPNESLFKWSKF